MTQCKPSSLIDYWVTTVDEDGNIVEIAVPVMPVPRRRNALIEYLWNGHKAENERLRLVDRMERMIDSSGWHGAHAAGEKYKGYGSDTLTTIIEAYEESVSSLPSFLNGARTEKRETIIRELAELRALDPYHKVSWSEAKSVVNTLRATHPLFAMEDLTELKDDEWKILSMTFTMACMYLNNGKRDLKELRNQYLPKYGPDEGLEEAIAKDEQRLPLLKHVNAKFIDMLLEFPDRYLDAMNYLTVRSIEQDDIDLESLRSYLNSDTPALSEGLL